LGQAKLLIGVSAIAQPNGLTGFDEARCAAGQYRWTCNSVLAWACHFLKLFFKKINHQKQHKKYYRRFEYLTIINLTTKYFFKENI
jgi:hypothetical protein